MIDFPLDLGKVICIKYNKSLQLVKEKNAVFVLFFQLFGTLKSHHGSTLFMDPGFRALAGFARPPLTVEG